MRFRSAGAPVVLVNVAFSPDFKDALRQPVDQPTTLPPGGFPADFSELVDGLAAAGDIRITKRQWGAFHGTELDLQLRRRGIQTIVQAGRMKPTGNFVFKLPNALSNCFASKRAWLRSASRKFASSKLAPRKSD